MPPRYRLACQCFVRHEDILVSFEGDQTLPRKPPQLTPAAKHYTGGLRIASLAEFHGFAIKVEADAALHFDKLSASMQQCGNQEVARLFAQLADFSRLHLAEAVKRAGSTPPTDELPPDYAWPDHETPERTALWAGDPNMSRLDALRAALVGERRGYEFYYAIAGTAKNPEVSAAAKEFYQEEAEHVQVLEAWITREEWLQKNPLPVAEPVGT